MIIFLSISRHLRSEGVDIECVALDNALFKTMEDGGPVGNAEAVVPNISRQEVSESTIIAV